MIINPMFFYMIHIADTFGLAMKICGPFVSLSGVILLFISCEISSSDEDEKQMIRCGKRVILIGIIILFIGLLIPNKETLLLMQAANLATTDNVNAIFEALKNAMDYAVSLAR